MPGNTPSPREIREQRDAQEARNRTQREQQWQTEVDRQTRLINERRQAILDIATFGNVIAANPAPPQPEVQTQNTRFTRMADGTVFDNGPQFGGNIVGEDGAVVRPTWVTINAPPIVQTIEAMQEPLGHPLANEDEDEDVEPALLQAFSQRQVEKLLRVSLSYINSYDPPTALSHINRWMRDEWGQGVADKYHGVAYKMALRKKKDDQKPKPPFLEQTFKAALGSRVKSVKGEIGLELEVEGANLFNSPVEWWTAVADGSLRAYKGAHPPVEYVLREPVGRKDVEPALRYLSDRLKSNKSEIVMSHRCSVHVHLNIQQMKMIHLMNFMSLYYIFEDVLMEHAAPERRGNLFCLRAKDASLQIENLVSAIQTGQWAMMMQNDFRYSAMNPAAMSAHGSLEFRSMRGTVDIETIKDWVTILLALKDSAGKFLNPSSISRIFKSIGPKEFLYRVFDGKIPPEILRRWASDKLTDERIKEGYQAVRDVLFAIDWTSPPEHMTSGVKVPPVPDDEPEFDRDRDDDDD